MWKQSRPEPANRRKVVEPSLAIVFLLAACGQPSTSSFVLTVEGAEKPAPSKPFAQLVPSLTDLLGLKPAEDWIPKLDQADIPESQEHHDALLQCLQSVDELSSDQLLLLVASVAPGYRPLPAGTSISINGVAITRQRAPRGEGPFAEVTDTLLSEGSAKLTDLDCRTAGRLLARCEALETMEQLSERWLPEIDDRSEAALEAILSGFGDYPRVDETAGILFLGQEPTRRSAVLEFLLEILLPSGGLEGERQHVAVAALSTNAEKVQAIGSIFAAVEELRSQRLGRFLAQVSTNASKVEVMRAGVANLGSVPMPEVIALIAEFSTNSSRVEAWRAAVKNIEQGVPPAQLREAVELQSTNSSRLEVLALLFAEEVSVGPGPLAEALDLFSTNSSRGEALRQCVREAGQHYTWREIADCVAKFTTSSSQLEGLRVLVGVSRGDLSTQLLQEILQTPNTDSSRLEMLRLLANDLPADVAQQQEDFVQLFSSSSSRKAASKLLQ
jgi:hypothetical protein